MSWTDLLSGRSAERPTRPLAHGQWRWDGSGRPQVRRAQIRHGDALLASPDGRFLSPALGDLRVDPGLVPDDDALRSLRSVAQGLRRRIGQPWSEWLDEPPLMPPMDKTLDETELEQELRSRLGHMEAACRRPRTHLKLEEERQLVGRCKRPSTRAPIVLAVCSEDWDRRTLWGIRPKKVLGLVREELYDLYENRLAVALVDRLDEALSERVREVRRIVQTARSREAWQGALEEGRNFRRAERVCRLWGELWTAGLLDRAERALRRLLLLRRRVLALKDSALYRRIGGQRREIHLRMTNVLTHDVYRGVAELWQAWERHVRAGREDAQTRWEWEQLAIRGFSLFRVLVVVRALEALRFEPTDDDSYAPLQPGGALRLDGPSGEVALRWDEDGALSIGGRFGEPLQILALPSTLEASPSSKGWLASNAFGPALVLHLAADTPRVDPETRLRLKGAGPRDQRPVFVPVAPWELESVERVARALRWHLWSALFARYPTRVSLPPAPWRAPARPPGWVRIEGNELHGVQPPNGSAGWAALEERVRKKLAARGEFERKRRRLDRKKQRDRLHLLQLQQEIEVTLDHDQTLLGRMQQAAADLKALLVCPVCGAVGSPYDFQQEGTRFRMSCSACDFAWGVRDCRACGELFPYLQHAEDSGCAPIDIDRVYGCDAIAFPIGPDTFLCACCGQRSDGANRGT